MKSGSASSSRAGTTEGRVQFLTRSGCGLPPRHDRTKALLVEADQALNIGVEHSGILRAVGKHRTVAAHTGRNPSI